MDSNINIQFHGFQPSAKITESLHDLCDRILQLAPNNSALSAVFSKNENLFKLTLQVNSSVKRFLGMATHSQTKGVLESVENQLRRQIEKWKTVRFEAVNLSDFDFIEDSNLEKQGGLHERDTVA